MLISPFAVEESHPNIPLSSDRTPQEWVQYVFLNSREGLIARAHRVLSDPVIGPRMEPFLLGPILKEIQNHPERLNGPQIGLLTRDCFGRVEKILRSRLEGSLQRLWKECSPTSSRPSLQKLGLVEESLRASRGLRFRARDFLESTEVLVWGITTKRRKPSVEILDAILEKFNPAATRRGTTDECVAIFETIEMLGRGLMDESPTLLNEIDRCLRLSPNLRTLHKRYLQPMMEVPPATACERLARCCDLSKDEHVTLVDRLGSLPRSQQALVKDLGSVISRMPSHPVLGSRPAAVLTHAAGSWLRGGYQRWKFTLELEEAQRLEEQLNLEAGFIAALWAKDCRWEADIGDRRYLFQSTSRLEDLLYVGDRPAVTCLSLLEAGSHRECAIATISDPQRRIVLVRNPEGDLLARATTLLAAELGASGKDTPTPSILVDSLYGARWEPGLKAAIAGGLGSAYKLPVLYSNVLAAGADQSTVVRLMGSRSGVQYVDTSLQETERVMHGFTTHHNQRVPHVCREILPVGPIYWDGSHDHSVVDPRPSEQTQAEVWLQEIFSDPSVMAQIQAMHLLPSGPLPEHNTAQWRSAMHRTPQALSWLHKSASLESRMGGPPKPEREGEDLRCAIALTENWAALRALVQNESEISRHVIHRVWTAEIGRQVQQSPGQWPVLVDVDRAAIQALGTLAEHVPSAITPAREGFAPAGDLRAQRPNLVGAITGI